MDDISCGFFCCSACNALKEATLNSSDPQNRILKGSEGFGAGISVLTNLACAGVMYKSPCLLEKHLKVRKVRKNIILTRLPTPPESKLSIEISIFRRASLVLMG